MEPFGKDIFSFLKKNHEISSQRSPRKPVRIKSKSQNTIEHDNQQPVINKSYLKATTDHMKLIDDDYNHDETVKYLRSLGKMFNELEYRKKLQDDDVCKEIYHLEPFHVKTAFNERDSYSIPKEHEKIFMMVTGIDNKGFEYYFNRNILALDSGDSRMRIDLVHSWKRSVDRIRNMIKYSPHSIGTSTAVPYRVYKNASRDNSVLISKKDEVEYKIEVIKESNVIEETNGYYSVRELLYQMQQYIMSKVSPKPEKIMVMNWSENVDVHEINAYVEDGVYKIKDPVIYWLKTLYAEDKKASVRVDQVNEKYAELCVRFLTKNPTILLPGHRLAISSISYTNDKALYNISTVPGLTKLAFTHHRFYKNYTIIAIPKIPSKENTIIEPILKAETTTEIRLHSIEPVNSDTLRKRSEEFDKVIKKISKIQIGRAHV